MSISICVDDVHWACVRCDSINSQPHVNLEVAAIQDISARWGLVLGRICWCNALEVVVVMKMSHGASMSMMLGNIAIV